MRKIFAVICLIFAAPAFAADVRPLTVDDALNINAALSQLNCGNRIIKDGAKESFVCEPYKWSAGMAWLIAGNQDKLKRVAAQYAAVRNQVVDGLSRDKDGKVTQEAEAKFAIMDGEWRAKDAGATLDRFKRSELEPMGLPPSVLAALMPIID